MGPLQVYTNARDHNTWLYKLWEAGGISRYEFLTSCRFVDKLGTRSVRSVQPRETLIKDVLASVPWGDPVTICRAHVAPAAGVHFPIDMEAVCTDL